MICPKCQTSNSDAARFCRNCGSALSMTCGNCGAALAAGDRFCTSCGQPTGTTTSADQDRLEHLNTLAPTALVSKIRMAEVTSDRKVVTAIFVDVVGSTTLAERMDAEEWTSIMNRAFELFSPTIYRYEGTVARLLGDALLAFFGAPITHEDDPVRAVRAALEILDAAGRYAEDVRRQHGIEFAVRIGINTGPVVVGNVGSDLKYEYTAMGDAINLAARMQSAARPMTALISQYTHKFSAPFFDFADLGLIEVKGKAEPIHAYEVTRLKAAPERARGLIGLDSPMVGRSIELESLQKLLAVVRATNGRAAVILGEPGLGKSRLLSEWKRTSPSVRWAEGQCLSYGTDLPYHLLLSLLHSLVGVTSVAPPGDVQVALQTLLD
ncbi:MAG TPA: adenylate/guanylate cyclase domain-containing protein, partial [Aggregatilineales bacterium]|nr:adenylate/guanylate cyclase domain-containing protein [Aggregatilineales bacterium]